MSDRAWRNWSRTARCRPARTVEPANLSELIAALAAARRDGLTVKPVGAGHSFNDIATTEGVHLALRRLDAVVAEGADTITVQGGMRLGAVVAALRRRGRALANLGDVSYQTAAGAIATGTHGSGIDFGPLSSQVEALQIVLADGELVRCSRAERPDLFHAALTGLGAVGVIVELTFRTVPEFRLRQVSAPSSLDELEAALPSELEANRHFDFMYDFRSGGVVMRRTNLAPESEPIRSRGRALFDDLIVDNLLYGLVCAANRRRPERIARHAERLPASSRADFVDRSDRVFTAPRRWPLVAAEYSVPVEDALPLVVEVGRHAREAGVAAGFPLFVRFVASDDAYLSPAFGRPSAFICPIALKPLPALPYLRIAEEVLRPQGARPHWGKWHGYRREDLEPLYPTWTAFQEVRAAVDPSGLFHNDHLDRVLGPVTAPVGAVG